VTRLWPTAGWLALAVLCWPERRRPTSLAGSLWPQRRAVGNQPTSARRRHLTRRPPAADQLLEILDMVSAQVRAGAAPVAAWAAAVELAGATGAMGLTVDPPLALHQWAARRERGGAAGRRDAAAPHAQAAAAAWRLAERTGAPLGDLLESVCATLRAHRADRAAVEAALAGPRATSRLLLGLPVAGIALGELVGAAPVDVLLTTPAGRTCGGLGLALLLLGRAWMHRLVARVGAPGRPATAAASAAATRPV
jgi:tight adherence protein B